MTVRDISTVVIAMRLVFLEPHQECLMSVLVKQRSCNRSVWFCLKSTQESAIL